MSASLRDTHDATFKRILKEVLDEQGLTVHDIDREVFVERVISLYERFITNDNHLSIAVPLYAAGCGDDLENRVRAMLDEVEKEAV